MFALHCPSCSTRRLFSAGQVRGLVNHDRGIDVTVECPCGTLLTFTTGRASEAPSADELAVVA